MSRDAMQPMPDGTYLGRAGAALAWLLLTFAMFFGSDRADAATCTSFTATAVNFGTYTGTVVSPGSSPFTINCPSGQSYQILLNQGQSSTGTETVRKMSNGTARLNYGLYQNAAHTTNFGNSSASGYVPGTGSGTAQTIPMYPQLTAGQNVATGTYTDTITASLGGASTGTTTFTVTATVTGSCTISAAALAFGTYISSASSNATSTLSLNCTTNITYTVGLDAGTTSGATVTTRSMTGPTANVLSYQLYQDAAHKVAWNTSDSTASGTGTGAAQTLTVYGTIASSQNVSPGSYKDTVTATVTY